MNQSFISDILYADIESKAKELTVNSNNTVQPVALMRLGVFVPKPSKSKGESKEIDATKAFSQLEIAKAEGYDATFHHKQFGKEFLLLQCDWHYLQVLIIYCIL